MVDVQVSDACEQSCEFKSRYSHQTIYVQKRLPFGDPITKSELWGEEKTNVNVNFACKMTKSAVFDEDAQVSDASIAIVRVQVSLFAPSKQEEKVL